MKLNKAEKFVKRTVEAIIDPDMDKHSVAWYETRKHLKLDSGFADVPDKRMPPEYEAAIYKFAPPIPYE